MTATWDDRDVAEARERLGTLAAALPGVEREEANGHTGYQVRARRFAWLMVDHHGDGRLALSLKAAPGEQEALVAGDPERYFVPSYLGARGWVGVRLDPPGAVDWDEVGGLLEEAWRMSAGKRAIAQLDATRAGS